MTVEVVFNIGPQIARALHRNVNRALRRIAFRYQGGVKARIQDGPKTGEIYWRSSVHEGSRALTVTYTPHQASAPGEAPATDTGALVNSIQTRVESELVVVVESGMEYAPHLEYGAPRANIAPRPAWTPEAELAARTYAPEEMRRATNEALRG